jgi:hypothetical protein
MTDLKQELTALAERRAGESVGDFTSVLTTATTRRRRRVGGWSAAACIALAVAGVVSLAPWQTHDGAPAPVATRPTLDPKYEGMMTITPATAAPGQEIRLTFPADYFRGVGFSLARPADQEVLYYLTSGRGGKPAWFSADDSAGGWPDVGIHGPGPDRVVVPTTAADGTYLLCTANAATQACALLTVAR